MLHHKGVCVLQFSSDYAHINAILLHYAHQENEAIMLKIMPA